MRLHRSAGVECCFLYLMKCMYFYRCDRGRSQRQPEWERVSFSSFTFLLQLLLFSTSRRKIVYNLSFGSHTRHTNGIRPKYFGKIYFSFLHHFSPFGCFGSCYFCDGCRARNRVWLQSKYLHVLVVSHDSKDVNFTEEWVARDRATTTAIYTHHLYTVIHIRICLQRISANCNEYLHLNESSGDDRSAHKTM